jgi:Ner family transcriptional regulator
MTKTEPVVWDRHAIKAEIGRRGLTMEAIAELAGIKGSQVRHGLLGSNRTGAKAIASALGIPFRTLFPNLYLNGRANEIKTSRNPRHAASQNEHVRVDETRRAS